MRVGRRSIDIRALVFKVVSRSCMSSHLLVEPWPETDSIPQDLNRVAVEVLLVCLLWVAPDVAVGWEAVFVARGDPFEPEGAVLGCGHVCPSHRRGLLDDCGCIEEVAEGLL